MKWSISPDTKNMKLGANRCSNNADTLPVESSCALNAAILKSHRAPSVAIASRRCGTLITIRSAATSSLSLSLCQYVVCTLLEGCTLAVAIHVPSLYGCGGAPGVAFVDGGIIGGPPARAPDGYSPAIYASAAPADSSALSAFVALKDFGGLRFTAVEGEGAGVGAASALKMSYAVSIG